MARQDSLLDALDWLRERDERDLAELASGLEREAYTDDTDWKEAA